ncbi:MAG: radical SAM protein [Bacteroidetes bacterium]|nr:radical SAM protein [Bacteroidota bacterium]MDA1121105.1 radical SAM protein [Bacteroidota bacterium]
MNSRKLEPMKYYRLPWSLTDNGISWLEVTTKCNLACKGCYRDPKKDGHKSLTEIASELLVFKTKRKSDCISIAGGDPLIHPKIVEIVRMIRDEGWKPIVNTNGLALTPEFLHELKEAGVAGFTFHIDTTQKRKDSLKALEEKDHNALRQKFADMVFAEGGLSCSFNQTVSEKTLYQVPDTINWAKLNPDKVHTIVLILYREPSMLSDFALFSNGKLIKDATTYNNTDFVGNKILKAQDVVDQIRRSDLTYEPSGYLNGTVDPDSLKWTVAIRYGFRNKTIGYAGSNFMKIVQNSSHFFRNRWLSYSSPKILNLGRLAMLFFSIFDKGSRRAFLNYLKNPLQIFQKVYLQTFAIIQPLDVMDDGQMNMCDGCPDITVYNGELYWSCRLEEIKEQGVFASAVPKKKLTKTKNIKANTNVMENDLAEK